MKEAFPLVFLRGILPVYQANKVWVFSMNHCGSATPLVAFSGIKKDAPSRGRNSHDTELKLDHRPNHAGKISVKGAKRPITHYSKQRVQLRRPEDWVRLLYHSLQKRVLFSTLEKDKIRTLQTLFYFSRYKLYRANKKLKLLNIKSA